MIFEEEHTPISLTGSRKKGGGRGGYSINIRHIMVEVSCGGFETPTLKARGTHAVESRSRKGLRHVAMVEKFLDNFTDIKPHLRK